MLEYWLLNDKKLEARTSLLELEDMRVMRDYCKNGKRHIVSNHGENVFYVTETLSRKGKNIVRVKDAATGIILLQITYNTNRWEDLQNIILRAAVYFYPVSTIGQKQMEDAGLTFVNNTVVAENS